jgi:hypothetical protein
MSGTTMTMTVNEALKVAMPCGAHEGETLGDIVGSDLLYLDAIIDAAWLDGEAREAVEVLWKHYEREIARLVA